jgi:hypothetical protein
MVSKDEVAYKSMVNKGRRRFGSVLRSRIIPSWSRGVWDHRRQQRRRGGE